jgi:hypothetical protein
MNIEKKLHFNFLVYNNNNAKLFKELLSIINNSLYKLVEPGAELILEYNKPYLDIFDPNTNKDEKKKMSNGMKIIDLFTSIFFINDNRNIDLFNNIRDIKLNYEYIHTIIIRRKKFIL